MIKTTKTFAQNLSANISNNIERYGFGAIALIILIELVWAASVLVPVLYLIATLIGSLKSWLAILPGFWGGVTFLLFLMVAAFVAGLDPAIARVIAIVPFGTHGSLDEICIFVGALAIAGGELFGERVAVFTR